MEELSDYYSYYSYIKEKINLGGYVGYMCSYVPPEIISASDFNPLPLIFPASYPERTDELYPKYFCPYIRNVNEYILRNELRLEKVVLTDGCDSSKRIYECWRNLDISEKIYFLKIPFNRDEKAVRYFAEELKAFYQDLSEDIKFEKLVEVIDFYNSLRREIKRNRLGDPLFILSLLTGNSFTSSRPIRNSNGLRVYLLSSMFPLDFVNYLSELGIEVIYLDACFGGNSLEEIKNYYEDPFYALSKYYLRRVTCVRNLDQEKRINLIKDLKGNIDGVIIYLLKFCDPLIYQVGRLREALKGLDLPVLLIEDDYTLGNKGQIRTRVEAFMEMIYERRKNNL
ncbi:MAG: 2-hydroxyacyl-CoA dehydratase family protein [Dictyoglomus thermophilum]|uniref:2-hydroxyacyl-CoA dehydratase n=1 Tax=Dictyoglomus thermophilum TaxID=14 RepID=A0A7V4DX21_DICTH|nr:2-hydroxyacyl-CoA dehydratase family protein [Dictyoglomus thermophilum]